MDGGELGGLAALDARDGDAGGCSLLAPDLGDTPAFRGAIQALLLLFKRLGRRIQQTEHLIHRLTASEVVLRQPAYPIVRAPVAVAPPVDAFAWVFGYAGGQREPCPLLRDIRAMPALGPGISRRATPCRSAAGDTWLGPL